MPLHPNRSLTWENAAWQVETSYLIYFYSSHSNADNEDYVKLIALSFKHLPFSVYPDSVLVCNGRRLAPRPPSNINFVAAVFVLPDGCEPTGHVAAQLHEQRP